MEAIKWFLFLALIVLSLIDWKKRELPSVLTTSVLFVVAVVNINNLEFGVLSFILGWLMMEGLAEGEGFFTGVADLKVITTLGFMINRMGAFLFAIVFLLMLGVVYKALMVYALKKKGEIAFIPVFLISYGVFLYLGVI